ncbi:MAG: recombinase RecA [Actinomycetota bacterium]
MGVADRTKSLDAVMAQIEKAHGKGAVMRLGDEVRVPIDVIPTGSIALDVALGIGGLPRGRVVEIYGPESSGKTTVALHAVASAQKAGGIAAFIDAEHALDPDYAQKLGVDTDALLVSQPDTGEQALEIADMLIRSGAIDIIVIDSVAALVPRAEIEGEMGDSHVGLQARLMSQALRKLTGTISSTNTTMIFINQLREKIGVMFGSPETTTGGKALKFYASVRLDVRRIETLKDGTDPVGNRTRVKVVKNKVAPPFKQAEFDIIYGLGISREGGLIDMGVEHGFVRKAGAWYTYEGDQLGQGKENARSFLKDNPDLSDEIEKKIKEKLGIGPRVDRAVEPIAEAIPGGGPATSPPAKAGRSVKKGSARARPVKDAPIPAVPVHEPLRDLPVRDASVGNMPLSSMPVGNMPVRDMPVNAVPVDF